MKYICELCGSIYDEDIGEAKRGIPPGTPFEKLPNHYDCPGCGCEKEAFTPVREQSESSTIKQIYTQGQYVKYSGTGQESQR